MPNWFCRIDIDFSGIFGCRFIVSRAVARQPNPNIHAIPHANELFLLYNPQSHVGKQTKALALTFCSHIQEIDSNRGKTFAYLTGEKL